MIFAIGDLSLNVDVVEYNICIKFSFDVRRDVRYGVDLLHIIL